MDGQDRVVRVMEALTPLDVAGFTTPVILEIVTRAIGESSKCHVFGEGEELAKVKGAINMKRQTMRWYRIKQMVI